MTPRNDLTIDAFLHAFSISLLAVALSTNASANYVGWITTDHRVVATLCTGASVSPMGKFGTSASRVSGSAVGPEVGGTRINGFFRSSSDCQNNDRD